MNESHVDDLGVEVERPEVGRRGSFGAGWSHNKTRTPPPRVKAAVTRFSSLVVCFERLAATVRLCIHHVYIPHVYVMRVPHVYTT